MLKKLHITLKSHKNINEKQILKTFLTNTTTVYSNNKNIHIITKHSIDSNSLY